MQLLFEKLFFSNTRLFSFVFLLCCFCFQATGEPSTLVLTDSLPDFRVQDAFISSCPEAGESPADGMLSRRLNSFRAFPENHTSQYHCYKFSVVNHSSQPHWYLQVPLHTEYVEVLYFTSQKQYSYSTGQFSRFDSRPVELRTLVFDLPTYSSDTTDVYIKLRSDKHFDASFIISNPTRYIEVHTKGYFFMGLIYGVLFLMGIYNFLLFLTIKEKIYLYYVLYVLSAAFFLSWKDGIGFQFLWPNTPEVNKYHHATGLFLLVNTLFVYAANFLELRDKYPFAWLLSILLLGSNLFYFVFHINDPFFWNPLPWPYIVGYLYFIGLTIYSLYHRYHPSYYLLITLIGTLLALLVIKFRYLGWLEWNWFVEYILNYTVVVDAIAMSLAIRDKIARMRLAQEKAREIQLTEERLKAENSLFQLRNDYLEKEVQYKNDELATLGTHLAQKTEYFQQLKKEIEGLLKEDTQNTALKKVLKDVERGSEFDDSWEQFQLNFDKVHNNFLGTLRNRYPFLKPTDLLFGAYVVMNKSNKEIATLLNITVSGVEKRHLRLKEKLAVSKDTSLSDYLQALKRNGVF